MAVGARVAGGARAVIGGGGGELGAVAAEAWSGLAGGDELVAVSAAVAGPAQADVLEGRGDLLAGAALGAQGLGAWVDVGVAEGPGVADWTLAHERV